MPYDTLRASGNNQYGQMTDVEKANFNSQQSAEDYILRKRMQDDALAAAAAQQKAGFGQQDSIQAKDFAQGLLTGGTFEAKNQFSRDQLDRAQAPAMVEARLREKAYNDQAPQRDIESFFLSNMLKGMGGGGAPGAAASPGAPATSGTPSSSTAFSPEQAMRMYGEYKNPAMIGAEDRRNQDHKWDMQKQRRDAENVTLTAAINAALAKNDMPTVLQLRHQQENLWNDNPSQGTEMPMGTGIDDPIAKAMAPSGAQIEGISNAGAEEARAGFDFPNTVADLKTLAKKAQFGQVDQNEVIDTAKSLVERLKKNNQVSDAQAKQMVGQELDAALPGVGEGTGFGNWIRGAASYIPGAAGRVTGEPLELRAALAAEGFPMRQNTLPTTQAAIDQQNQRRPGR